MFVAMETGILQDSICPSSVCVKQRDNISHDISHDLQ